MADIEEYFYRLSPKNRTIIWLLAMGYNATEIRDIKAGDLGEIMDSIPTKYPDLRVWCESRAQEADPDDHAFEKQQGKAMGKDYILSLLIKAHERLDEEFTSVQDFVERIGIAEEA